MNVFGDVLESACLYARVSVCVQNITFCQSAGEGIKSHLVTALVYYFFCPRRNFSSLDSVNARSDCTL